MYATDIDGDGDLDVLSASAGLRQWLWGGGPSPLYEGHDDKIAWYENTDGKGSFGPQRVITTLAEGAMSVYAADLDGDGDMDVLSASAGDSKIAWYENFSPKPGDANCDTVFNQLDIVQVLQAAKYQTGEPATWQQGDWNGDELFDQLDLVAALQTGNYLKGAYAARAADEVFAAIRA